ncbi:IgG-binding virulence factor TspB family protein [Neisseria musculi]|uniref:Neisseria meningitidis TspB family protein n=1 Tax=Neisseria musculi TaxID=1815583 RepID=A0A7H1MEF7_9NEIS|nr:IgG-binding virulence factor TspB family protein [Neisseria musculi]QNT60022.1 neisseria meningitidis TspB family protein [Neisseria musculi]
MSLKVRHASSGMVASSSVSARIVSTVPRQTVLRNLLGKAIAGGRLAAGVGSGPVGWGITAATVAKTAYDLVAPTLEANDYRWDAEKSNFITDKEYKYCLLAPPPPTSNEWKEVECVGLGKISRQLDLKSWEHLRPIRDAICRKHWQSLLPEYKPEDGYRLVPTPMGRGCTAVSDTDYGRSAGNWRWYENTTQTITQSEFDRIIGPLADNNPTPYVNATADEKGNVPGVQTSPDVTVPNGTIVTIGPYTDSDGQPKQITVTFNTANGQTNVTVRITPRADLTPKSPTAPSSSPGSSGKPGNAPSSGSSPNSGNSNSPGISPGGSPQTDGNTRTETLPKKDTDKKDNPSGDKKDKPDPKSDEKQDEKQDGGLLCNVFPDILACDKQPEAEEPDLPIPEETVNLNFTPDNTFADNGQCPEPVTFAALGGTYSISLQPACDLAALMRPFIIAMAWLVASFFVVRVVRENA